MLLKLDKIMKEKKVALADLAKVMGVVEQPIVTLEWEEEGIKLCVKCGCKMIRNKEDASIRICAKQSCDYKKQIRYEDRQVGEYTREDKHFRRRIIDAKDFFKKLSSFGLAQIIIDRLETLGCETIVLRDKRGFCSYSVDFDTFMRHSFGYMLESGSIMQYLHIKYWIKKENKKRYNANYSKKDIWRKEKRKKESRT